MMERMRNDQVSRCDKCIYYFRTVTTFLLSHIGLFSLVIGYTIMGAFAFQGLEIDHEEERRNQTRDILDQLVIDLWNETLIQNTSRVLQHGKWTKVATEKLKGFEEVLMFNVSKNGFDGSEERQWTFSGALLYSIIVITTIGYGNVAPKTAWGKVVTILYAVVGIPLMLLCMSNVGETMAQSFKFVYWKVCCFFCVRSKRARRAARSIRYPRRYPSMRSRPGSSSHRSSTRSGTQGDDEMSGAGSYYGNTADEVLDKYDEEPVDSFGSQKRRRPLHASPAAPIQTQPKPGGYNGGGAPSSTEGTQHDAREVPIILNKYVLESKEDLRVDLPPAPHKDGYMNHLQTHPPTTGSGRSPRHLPPQPPQRLASMDPMRRHSSRRSKYRHHDEADYGGVDSEDEMEVEQMDQELDKEHITVPIWLCCALVTGYVCGGAALFQYWENWSFLDSFYFCFVTLTTIGFGDLVPGNSVIGKDSQTTLTLCALYLLFGMALLAMSFNLVQEQVTSTVKGIGKMIGIVEDDEDDDDEDQDE